MQRLQNRTAADRRAAPVRANSAVARAVRAALLAAGLAAAMLAGAPAGAEGFGPEAPAETTSDGVIAGHRTLFLGVVETAEPGFDDVTVEPVVRALHAAAPAARIEVLRLSSATFEETVAQLKPDLLIAPSADYLRIVDSIGAHPIGTRKTKYAKHPSKSAGAAVIAAADRTDITNLPSLMGSSAAATLPTSLDGMLALRMELRGRGLEDEKFFRSVRYLGYSMPNVVEAVLAGKFDAGVVPVCTVERLEAEGLIERGVLRVVSPKDDDDSVCAHTTALYPDLVAASFPWTDPELTRLTTSALLAPATGSEYAWYGTSDFHAVRALEEELHIGPWAYLEDVSPAGLWRRFRYFILAGLGALGLLILNEWRLRALVARRTAELKRTLVERDRYARRERAVRDRLAGLERMGAISQLSAMIAHELKQPVGAVINYVAVVKLKLGLTRTPGMSAGDNDGDLPIDPLLIRALDGAEEQARRIAAIVDRVRGYARRQHADPVPVNVVEAAQAALRSLAEELRPFVTLRKPLALESDPEPLIVMGDPLEMELLLLNVIKNAAEAVRNLKDGVVVVKFSRIAPAAESPRRTVEVLVRIEDNGLRISDEAFERLTRVSQSVKEEGLGLGLGIVRSLVEENGGRIAIARREDLGGRGLRVELRFDLERGRTGGGDEDDDADGGTAEARTETAAPQSADA